jgi:hypothetical protein
MKNVLIDSSVWINYFRRGESVLAAAVDELLDAGRVVLCGMVELEIIQGLRQHERQLVESLFQALPYIETTRQDFIEAGNRLAELRQTGITIPAADGLIATLCIRHQLMLFSLDNHFDYLSDLTRYQPSSP